MFNRRGFNRRAYLSRTTFAPTTPSSIHTNSFDALSRCAGPGYAACWWAPNVPRLLD